MKKFFRIIAILGFFPLSLLAQEGDFQADPVRVLENPKYSLKEKFHIDLNLMNLPLDAYYKPLTAELAGSYQFNDFLTWEALRIGINMASIGTGLKSDIESQLPQGQNKLTIEGSEDMKNLRYYMGSTAYLNLLYSKSNFFNRKIIYHQWQVGAGPTFVDMDEEKQFGLEFSVRVRFFIDDRFNANIRLGHSIGLTNDHQRNISFIGLGGGIAF